MYMINTMYNNILIYNLTSIFPIIDYFYLFGRIRQHLYTIKKTSKKKGCEKNKLLNLKNNTYYHKTQFHLVIIIKSASPNIFKT